MIKITLDTNCIINLLDFKATTPTSVDELSEIIRYSMEGDANIAITTRVESDFNNDPNSERKKEMMQKIRMFPVIGTVARFGSSKYDSGDWYTGQEDQSLEEELKAILFPALDKKDPRYSNKINDIDHLIGHIKHKRDIFVTDDQGILRRAEKIKEAFSTQIMNPSQCLEYLDLRDKKDVLVQHFLEKVRALHDLIKKTIDSGYSPSMEPEYEKYREWLLKKFPKIHDGLLSFRHRMKSVPIGGQRVFDQMSLMDIQRIPGIFESLWAEHSLKKKIDTLFAAYGQFGMPKESKERELAKEFNFPIDLLTSYVGYLEND